jgi:FRG domain
MKKRETRAGFQAFISASGNVFIERSNSNWSRRRADRAIDQKRRGSVAGVGPTATAPAFIEVNWAIQNAFSTARPLVAWIRFWYSGRPTGRRAHMAKRPGSGMQATIALSWDEILDCVKQARAALGDSDQLWFRGQANAAYALLPSLMRSTTGVTKEQFLFQKFVQYSLRTFPRRASDWDTLFDMQHYGIPTRLVDWSENLEIAIFFAANYGDRGSLTSLID